MTSRNSVGLGSLFCGYRFSLMNDRLFNYFSYTGGDNRKLFYELNYMPNDNVLFDYIYKRKIDDDLLPVFLDVKNRKIEEETKFIKNKDKPNFIDTKHYFTLHKMLTGKTNRMSIGLIKNNKNFLLNFSQKYSFIKETSIRTSLKASSDSFKFKCRIKQNINDSFYCKTEQSLKYDGIGFNVFNSRLFYKNNSNIFSLGGFFSFDGLGIELGYKFGGVYLKLPVLIWQNEFIEDRMFERDFLYNLIEYGLCGMISVGLGFASKFIISKIAQFRKLRLRRIDKSIIAEKRENILKMKNKFLKSLEILVKSAEKYHALELDKKEKGLIVHLALYGRFEKLERFKKDFDYISNKFKKAKAKNSNTNTDEFNIPMKIKEYKIEEECDNIENEMIDVTMSVRNKISSIGQNVYSSILFRELTKTSIFGFFNPIFKTDDMPYFLIVYEIQNEIKVLMKKDSDIFQIPEEIIIK